jgi:hypothetical protein
MKKRQHTTEFKQDAVYQVIMEAEKSDLFDVLAYAMPARIWEERLRKLRLRSAASSTQSKKPSSTSYYHISSI